MGPNDATGKRMDAEQKPAGIFECIINTDAAIVHLSPEQGSYRDCFGDSMPLALTLRNMAVQPINSATVHINSSSGQAFNETFALNLIAGDSINLVMTQPLALLSTFDTVFARVDVAQDGNSHNDTIIHIYQFPASALTIPKVTEDFESFANCSMDPLCETIECSIGNGWFNEKNGEADDIDWRVSSGVTPTEFTGPVTDHTTGSSNGKYIYLESSDCYFKTAMLTSPCIDLDDATTPTLTFWYHMHGGSVGSLNVDVLDSSGWNLNIFNLYGEQGSEWKFASVDLSAFTGQIIVIRFRGTTGNGFQSDIALDDIGITHPPVSKFAYSIQLDGLTVDFVDLSTYADTMTFETGDGFTYGSLPLSHSYAQAQGYLVKQTVFNQFGSDASIQALSTLGIEARNNDIYVFPNPASDELHLKMNFPIQNMEIFSSTGELVRKMNIESASNQLDLNVLHIESGYYIIRVNGTSLIPLSVIH
ncbi:MAG: T9SS type A sorting domain-containing protein [Flavobacteriales bacterium]